ncbi:LysR family transcriptional regulator [uncultured Bartonella sp.]|uniref:LysR family transcriptional regulator n=1 Tax=uncultured Bartonella sp. TaxID=104108 RepID=UPI00260C13CA|nr:LysR family transcriptional regulator [uncultured Bartonella sp.]
MLRENIHDLMSFFVVAREKSFTRAASQLGVSQSALSHAMRGLEERLGLRLLTRTTRSVSPTDAGERLIEELVPLINTMQEKLDIISNAADEPKGKIRITTVDYPASHILWPKLRPFMKKYPQIEVEISINYGLTDIIEERFDAGIRLGEHLAKDMIAMPIGPAMRMAVVGTPSYFSHHKRPQTLDDLMEHNCINLRVPTSGGLYPWEFDDEHGEVKVRPKGQLVFNTYPHILEAVLDGFGLAYIPEGEVEEFIKQKRLIRVLEQYCIPFPGYYLYYPNRRHHPIAFQLLIAALRQSEN